MTDYAVSIAFNGHDMITSRITAMTEAVNMFGRSSTAAMDRASRAGSKTESVFGSVFKGIMSSNILMQGLDMLKQVASDTTKEFIDFDQSITSASAKFSDLLSNTSDSQKNLELLKATARKVGIDTQFSAGDAARGLDNLAQSGFTSRQAMVSLRPAVDLATIGNVDLSQSVSIAADSLGAFNLKAEESTVLQENFNRLNNAMAVTLTRGNVNMEQLYQTVRTGAASFTQAGQSMETFMAMTGLMAKNSLKGEMAGTNLKNMMIRLSKPSNEAARMMDRLKLRAADSNGNFRDAVDIIADLEKGLKSMGSEQRTAALSTIFGSEAVTGINILMAQGSEKLRAFRNEIIKNQTASSDMADRMRQGLGVQLDNLKSSVVEVGMKLLSAFEQKGKAGIIALTEAINNFDVQPVIDGTKKIVSGFENIISTANIISKIFSPFGSILNPLIENIDLVIIGVMIMKSRAATAFIGMALDMGIANAASIMLGTSLSGIFSSIWTFMTTNPIGIIVVGILAWISVLRFAFENWMTIFRGFFGTSFWKDLGSFIITPFRVAFNWIGQWFVPQVLMLFDKLILSLEKYGFGIFFNMDDARGNLKMQQGIIDKYDNMQNARETASKQGRNDWENFMPGGSDYVDPSAPKSKAPNQTALQAQAAAFTGNLYIHGAPAGSTMDSINTGASSIDMTQAGVN